MELAEIGVILLMFGVGLHFSLKDLLSVRAIAMPGAIVQIASRHPAGHGAGLFPRLDLGAGFVFGLALSVASTVVLLRALQERRLIDTERGRIAVGWLIVEDLAMVLALVLLPALAGVLWRQRGEDPMLSSNPDHVGSGADRHHFRQGRGFRDCDAGDWPARHPMGAALGRAYRLARTVPAGGARDRARRCLCGVDMVRRVLGARRVLRRHDDERVRSATGARRTRRCRCATRSRCCSSSRSACCSTRRSCARPLLVARGTLHHPRRQARSRPT
jgi:hypothetical protein